MKKCGGKTQNKQNHYHQQLGNNYLYNYTIHDLKPIDLNLPHKVFISKNVAVEELFDDEFGGEVGERDRGRIRHFRARFHTVARRHVFHFYAS
jgi:hypothetical protein